MKAYLAAGWFTEEQEKARLEVLEALTDAGIEVYSPKDDLMYDPKTMSALDVFNENTNQIDSSDLVVASTEGKDMGTIFECGYAFNEGVPIVYYYKGEGKFNLMLSESGHAVFSNKLDLTNYLTQCKMEDTIFEIPYEGEKE